jgi:predicted N-formylglutamate amidohydrolase
MDQIFTFMRGGQESDILLIADHASNHVPADIDLRIDPALLTTHIAVDLGVAELGAALCAKLDCPGIFAGVSRLVIDLNREDDASHLVPLESDGQTIPGNALTAEQRDARTARFWRPYHAGIAKQIARQRPTLILSLHSFTPQLKTRPEEERPWEVGILYNQDDHAARVALPLFEQAGVCVGDQLPYSGKLLNATMNAHAEANSIAYLGIEMRQDLITDAAGVAHWTKVLVPVIDACRASLD